MRFVLLPQLLNPLRLDIAPICHSASFIRTRCDKLFDRGWITFTDAGDLRCAEPSIERALQQWGISLPKNVGPFDRKQVIYFAYHREVIFMG